MSLNFIIPLVVYPFDVMVSVAEQNDVLEKRLKKYGANVDSVDLTYSDTARGRCVMFPGGQTLIRVYSWPKSPVQFGHLQHEVFHAVEFLMERIGNKLTIDSDEAYAYLIGYLTEKIYEKVGCPKTKSK